jgi:four helix bundle protein
MGRAFVDLRVYALAAEVGDELSRVVDTWPSFEKWSIGMQLVRAADSVAANIAEASGRWHEADKRRLFIIARGSLYETEHWVERAKARGLPIDTDAERLSDLARMLSGLVRRPSPR